MRRVPRELDEVHTMLGQVVVKKLDGPGPATALRRALANLDELGASGFGSTTPGNGSPGGGKGGGGRTLEVRWGRTGVDRVPITSVEAMALAGPDEVARARTSLEDGARLLADCSATAVRDMLAGNPPAPRPGTLGAMHYAWWCVSVLHMAAEQGRLRADRPLSGWRPLYQSTERVYHVCTRWGFTATTPAPGPDRDLLPHDLTELNCRACLYVGRREKRFRGELCEWCYRFSLKEGFTPTRRLIEDFHANNRRGLTAQLLDAERAAFKARKKRERPNRRV
jgi:hypothetical protein